MNAAGAALALALLSVAVLAVVVILLRQENRRIREYYDSRALSTTNVLEQLQRQVNTIRSLNDELAVRTARIMELEHQKNVVLAGPGIIGSWTTGGRD